MTAYGCTSCGGPVAASARRCPHCGEKRPAPTVENAVKTGIGLVVILIVLIAVLSGGHSGGGDKYLQAVTDAYGACVSVDGADVQSSAVSGWHAVFLSDGAEFGVRDSDLHAEPGNSKAFDDAAGC